MTGIHDFPAFLLASVALAVLPGAGHAVRAQAHRRAGPARRALVAGRHRRRLPRSRRRLGARAVGADRRVAVRVRAGQTRRCAVPGLDRRAAAARGPGSTPATACRCRPWPRTRSRWLAAAASGRGDQPAESRRSGCSSSPFLPQFVTPGVGTVRGFRAARPDLRRHRPGVDPVADARPISRPGTSAAAPPCSAGSKGSPAACSSGWRQSSRWIAELLPESPSMERNHARASDGAVTRRLPPRRPSAVVADPGRPRAPVPESAQPAGAGVAIRGGVPVCFRSSRASGRCRSTASCAIGSGGARRPAPLLTAARGWPYALEADAATRAVAAGLPLRTQNCSRPATRWP